MTIPGSRSRSLALKGVIPAVAGALRPRRYAYRVWPMDGPYAVGVTFHSPGSRRGLPVGRQARAQSAPWVTNATRSRIPRRGFTKMRYDVASSVRPYDSTLRVPLYNAFGVSGRLGSSTQGAPSTTASPQSPGDPGLWNITASR